MTSAIANYVSSKTPDGSKEGINSEYNDSPSRLLIIISQKMILKINCKYFNF